MNTIYVMFVETIKEEEHILHRFCSEWDESEIVDAKLLFEQQCIYYI